MIDARQNGLSAVQQAHADRFLAQLKHADRNRTVSHNSPARLPLTPPPAAPTPPPPQPAPTAPAPAAHTPQRPTPLGHIIPETAWLALRGHRDQIRLSAQPRLPHQRRDAAQTTLKLYGVLVEAALLGYAARNAGRLPPRSLRRASCVLLSEIVQEALGISESTYLRHMSTLASCGLIHTRPVYGTATNPHTGVMHTVKAATLVDVVLTPQHNTTAYAHPDDAREHSRDLDADRDRGATAYRWVLFAQEARSRLLDLRRAWQQTIQPGRKRALQEQIEQVEESLKPLSEEWISTFIYRITVKSIPTPPVAVIPSLAGEAATPDVLPYFAGHIGAATGGDRTRLITVTARALARSLRDDHSVRYWAGLLTQAAELHDQGIEALYRMQDAYLRVLNDLREWPDLLRPAALFNARYRAPARAAA